MENVFRKSTLKLSQQIMIKRIVFIKMFLQISEENYTWKIQLKMVGTVKKKTFNKKKIHYDE